MDMRDVAVGMSVVIDGKLETSQEHLRGEIAVVQKIKGIRSAEVMFQNGTKQELFSERFNSAKGIYYPLPPPMVPELKKPSVAAPDANELIQKSHTFLCGLGQYFNNDHTDTALQRELRDLIRQLGKFINPKMYEIDKRATYERVFKMEAKSAGFNTEVQTGRISSGPPDLPIQRARVPRPDHRHTEPALRCKCPLCIDGEEG